MFPLFCLCSSSFLTVARQGKELEMFCESLDLQVKRARVRILVIYKPFHLGRK